MNFLSCKRKEMQIETKNNSMPLKLKHIYVRDAAAQVK